MKQITIGKSEYNLSCIQYISKTKEGVLVHFVGDRRLLDASEGRELFNAVANDDNFAVCGGAAINRTHILFQCWGDEFCQVHFDRARLSVSAEDASELRNEVQPKVETNEDEEGKKQIQVELQTRREVRTKKKFETAEAAWADIVGKNELPADSRFIEVHSAKLWRFDVEQSTYSDK